MSDEDDTVKAWTDGSCSWHKGKQGGWAFYMEYGLKTATRYGYDPQTTTNVMELTAILRVLQFVRLTPHPLTIYTDSQYSRRCIVEWGPMWRNRGWKVKTGGNVANKDLIEDLLKYLEAHQKVRKVEIKWIRGHNGHLNNERCDALARTAREQKMTNWTPNTNRVD